MKGNVIISKNLAKKRSTDPNELFNCMIAGAAGDGIMSAGQIFSKIMAKHNYNVLLYTEYPSLVRGGHNTVTIRVGKDKVRSQVSHVDILFAINLESIEKHIDEVTENGIIIYDPKILRRKTIEDFNRDDISWRDIPLREIVQSIGATKIVQNTVGIAAIMASIGIPKSTYTVMLNRVFAKKPKILEVNHKAVDLAYDYVKSHFADFRIKLSSTSSEKSKYMLISGNQAIVAGLIAGGMGVYSGYPMAPSSSILAEVVKFADKYNYSVLQAEDEIAAVMNAMGANHAGARGVTATSGGGLALMVEAIGLASSSETPLVIVDVMRPGPSTGLPTWTGQPDLLFAIRLGQDTFPRVVLAPGDVTEAYQLGIEALNYAEEYQLPVIILSDKWLGMSYFSCEKFSNDDLEIRTGKTYLLDDETPEGEYKRFAITDDGVSPRAIPGNPENMIFRTTGNEHDEYGIVDDTAENRIAQMDKRMKKLETMLKAFPDPKIYGVQASDADITFITWGTNKGVLIELMRRLEGIKVSIVHITHVWPFPAEFIAEAINVSKLPVLVEQNSEAQLGQLIRNECLLDIDNKILRYDGRPFDPVDLERIVRDLLN